MTTPVPSHVKQRLRKLAQLVTDLEQGRDFNITRLTVIKSLGVDPDAAARFAVFIAHQAHDAMLEQPRPERIPEERWARYRELVAAAVQAMDAQLESRTEGAFRELHSLRSALERLQNQTKAVPYGFVRIVENEHALLIETALRVVADPENGADWCYQLARTFAERYGSRYGTGLIPASAPAVATIVDFWCRHYLGVPLDEWRRR